MAAVLKLLDVEAPPKHPVTPGRHTTFPTARGENTRQGLGSHHQETPPRLDQTHITYNIGSPRVNLMRWIKNVMARGHRICGGAVCGKAALHCCCSTAACMHACIRVCSHQESVKCGVAGVELSLSTEYVFHIGQKYSVSNTNELK